MLKYAIGFVVGAVVSYFFSYLMSLGHSINVLKQTQKSCAALFVTSEQGLQEILYLKYMAMDETGRSQQSITAQKYIDQMSIDSVRKAIMRNYTGVFPQQYKNIMEYTSWEEMEDYVNTTLKSGEKIS
tara:strand:- start:2980 stop:3363 length:384 start_codon:yes stop_codon:yes gene_type:complete